MGERMKDIKHGVVTAQREYNQEQRVAFRTSKPWFLAVPVVLAAGVLIAWAGSGILDTIGGVTVFAAVMLLFVALWKHVGAGGDDFGAGSGASWGA
jgi:anti-sigma factor RsiW